MENNQKAESTENELLHARIANQEELVKHLRDQTDTKELKNRNLVSKLLASHYETMKLKQELAEAKATIRQLEEDGPDREFESWLRRNNEQLPATLHPGPGERAGASKSVSLPSLRLTAALETRAHTFQQERSQRPAEPGSSLANEPEGDVSDDSSLSSPPRSSEMSHRSLTPVVKHEEADSDVNIHDAEPVPTLAPEPASTPAFELKRGRKGVISTGRRAPKRKNPDNYTDDPPTPYGQRRSKRLYRSVNYKESESENIEELARNIWDRESQPRTPAKGSQKEHEDAYIPDPDENKDEEVEEGQATSIPAGTSGPPVTEKAFGAATASTAKSRYKKRPTHNQERMAKGTTVHVNFRFLTRPRSIAGIYKEWHHGNGENPPIGELEEKHGANWRNAEGRENSAYANDWVSKRQKVVMALEHFAQLQKKDPLELAELWDKAIGSKFTIFASELPAPTHFPNEKHKLPDPLTDFHVYIERRDEKVRKQKELKEKKAQEKREKEEKQRASS